MSTSALLQGALADLSADVEAEQTSVKPSNIARTAAMLFEISLGSRESGDVNVTKCRDVEPQKRVVARGWVMSKPFSLKTRLGRPGIGTDLAFVGRRASK